MIEKPKRLPTAPSRILLIEDEENLQLLSKRAIHGYFPGAEIAVASDGRQAIEFLDKWYELPVDLIFLDIHMPGMDGHEFLATWYRNRNFEEPPVVVLATSSNEEAGQLAEFRCVRGVLEKPLTPASLRTLFETTGAYFDDCLAAD